MLGGGFSPLTEQMYYIGGTNSGNAETYTLDTGTSLILRDAMMKGRFNI